MRISDLVAEYIKNILDESNGTAEIQRNELANNIGCVPSQINYVISSRFTQENGYVVESRRGGGGYIRITRVHLTTEKGGIIMHVVNSVGETLDETSANFIQPGATIAEPNSRRNDATCRQFHRRRTVRQRLLPLHLYHNHGSLFCQRHHQPLRPSNKTPENPLQEPIVFHTIIINYFVITNKKYNFAPYNIIYMLH